MKKNIFFVPCCNIFILFEISLVFVSHLKIIQFCLDCRYSGSYFCPHIRCYVCLQFRGKYFARFTWWAFDLDKLTLFQKMDADDDELTKSVLWSYEETMLQRMVKCWQRDVCWEGKVVSAFSCFLPHRCFYFSHFKF